MSDRRAISLVLAVLVIGVFAAAILAWRLRQATASSQSGLDRATSVSVVPGHKRHAATLYCEFWSLTHTERVVSFDFAVEAPNTLQPRYSEVFVVEPDGTRTVFDGVEQAMPVWTFSRDDETPILTAANGQTRIKLYGLKQDEPSVSWFEAGIRNNAYRNLGGKCRQAYFGNSGQASDAR